MTTIQKQLALYEDLSSGVGTESQSRGGTNVTGHKLDIPIPLASLAEVANLDVNRFSRARVVSNQYYFDLVYVSTATSGVQAPSTGTGYWVEYGDNTLRVANIAELRAVPAVQLYDSRSIYLLGHTNIGVGSGPAVVKGTRGSETDNNGTVLVIGTKVVIRVGFDEVTPEMFGGGIGNSALDFAALTAIAGMTATLVGTYTSEPITVTGRWDGKKRGVINIVKASDTVEFNALTVDGIGASVKNLEVRGGTSSSSTYASRTFRGVRINQGASEFEVFGLVLKWFKVVGIETFGVGTTVPSRGSIKNCVMDGGTTGFLNGCVIKGGNDIEVSGNKVYNAFNQCYTVSDASRLTPISQYARNFDINIHDNYGYMIDPPQAIASNIDSAIKIGGGLRLKANNNTIVYGGTKNHLSGAIGKGLEIKLYDLSQQRARNDGTLGTNEGTAFPFTQSEVLPEASGNVLVGFHLGCFLNGVYNPKVYNNTFAATQTGLLIQSQGATIQGIAYAMPSAEGNTNTRADIKGNKFVSLDPRNVGSGNAFTAIDYRTNYNKAEDNEFYGKIATRHGGTNTGVQNRRRDGDGRTYGVSDTAYGDFTGSVSVAQGNINQVVSGSLQQGGQSKMNLAFETTASDYTVLVEPNWATTWHVPSAQKSNTQFRVDFGTAAPANAKIRWAIILKTSELA